MVASCLSGLLCGGLVLKEQHIVKVSEMVSGDEYTINWCEESGALIKKIAEGFILQDCSYGNIGSEEFYREDEVDELVTEAMSYT